MLTTTEKKAVDMQTEVGDYGVRIGMLIANRNMETIVMTKSHLHFACLNNQTFNSPLFIYNLYFHPKVYNNPV